MRLLLGKRPPRRDLRNLKLARYIQGTLPPAPLECAPAPVTNLGTMLNDLYGCCTIAAAGHQIQNWTAARGAQVIVSDADILTAYEGACGYVPGDKSTDRGGVELDVLNYWRKTGIGSHKIGAHVVVDPKNLELIRQTIYLFGGAYTGFALPDFVLEGDEPCPWVFPGNSSGAKFLPKESNGHAVPFVGYNAIGPIVESWGLRLQASWQFVLECCDEVHAVLSPDQLMDSGMTPAGFNNEQLADDLRLVAA